MAAIAEPVAWGILLLWILEFGAKATAYGPRRYFFMEKLEFVVIPILIIPQIHSAIDVYLPALAVS